MMIAEIDTSVDIEWWFTTLSITCITIRAGKMVSRLSTTEAIEMSRSDFFSRSTMRVSQPMLIGASASDWLRLRATSTTSPFQTCDRRSSSTATGVSPSLPIGSRSQTTPRPGSAPTSSAAEPSLNISAKGGLSCMRTR